MDEFILNLKLAITTLYSILDWVYILMFILTAYTVVRLLKESNLMPKVKIKLRKLWIVLITAVVIALIFGLFYWLGDGLPWYSASEKVPYSLAIFMSMLIGLFANEVFGIENILDKLFKVTLKK
jgi:hypothetical protein